jgi:hypothetical protein
MSDDEPEVVIPAITPMTDAERAAFNEWHRLVRIEAERLRQVDRIEKARHAREQS